jgi:hypothetical protein
VEAVPGYACGECEQFGFPLIPGFPPAISQGIRESAGAIEGGSNRICRDQAEDFGKEIPNIAGILGEAFVFAGNQASFGEIQFIGLIPYCLDSRHKYVPAAEHPDAVPRTWFAGRVRGLWLRPPSVLYDQVPVSLPNEGCRIAAFSYASDYTIRGTGWSAQATAGSTAGMTVRPTPRLVN